jgi:hypothetical protein
MVLAGDDLSNAIDRLRLKPWRGATRGAIETACGVLNFCPGRKCSGVKRSDVNCETPLAGLRDLDYLEAVSHGRNSPSGARPAGTRQRPSTNASTFHWHGLTDKSRVEIGSVRASIAIGSVRASDPRATLAMEQHRAELALAWLG